MKDIRSEDLPHYIARFTEFRVVEAMLRTESGSIQIILETRLDALGNEAIFTVVDDRKYRADSIHALLGTIPDVRSIAIDRSVHILWNHEISRAIIREVYIGNEDGIPNTNGSLKIRLIRDNLQFESEASDTLTDAICDIQEEVEPDVDLWLMTCFHCKFAGHALNYLVGDREFWCYRDAPEAFEDVLKRGKSAKMSSRFAGAFFVNAFHTCAAWELRQPPSRE